MELKGSQTEKNIMAAFIGESQARNKYTFWASKAKNEEFIAVQMAFLETAEQEKEHAKRLFKFLEGGEFTLEVTAGAGVIGTTLENLRTAAAGENHEWQHMYPDFAKVARDEGYTAVAVVMEAIAVAEKQHARRYEAFAAHIEKGEMWVQETPTTWRCLNCGYVYTGPAAPNNCPACAHPQGYFERLSENF